MKKRIIEIAVKMLVAALTAFLTAITTTSCMGRGPFWKWEIRSVAQRLRSGFIVFCHKNDWNYSHSIVAGGFDEMS